MKNILSFDLFWGTIFWFHGRHWILIRHTEKIRVFRIYRIHMFLALPDQDPLVRGIDPGQDPSIIKQN